MKSLEINKIDSILGGTSCGGGFGMSAGTIAVGAFFMIAGAATGGALFAVGLATYLTGAGSLGFAANNCVENN